MTVTVTAYYFGRDDALNAKNSLADDDVHGVFDVDLAPKNATTVP